MHDRVTFMFQLKFCVSINTSQVNFFDNSFCLAIFVNLLADFY